MQERIKQALILIPIVISVIALVTANEANKTAKEANEIAKEVNEIAKETFQKEYFPSIKRELSNNLIFVENTGKVPIFGLYIQYYFKEDENNIFGKEWFNYFNLRKISKTFGMINPEEKVSFSIPDNFREENKKIVARLIYLDSPICSDAEFGVCIDTYYYLDYLIKFDGNNFIIAPIFGGY